jgi:hypothetical protein
MPRAISATGWRTSPSNARASESIQESEAANFVKTAGRMVQSFNESYKPNLMDAHL